MCLCVCTCVSVCLYMYTCVCNAYKHACGCMYKYGNDCWSYTNFYYGHTTNITCIMTFILSIYHGFCTGDMTFVYVIKHCSCSMPFIHVV